jgi:hypothetical protein
MVAGMKRILRLLACACLAAASAASADEASLDLSPLDLEAGPDTAQPSVAVDPGRGFIVTWQRRAGPRASLAFAELAPGGVVARRGVIADSATTGVDGAAARWFVNWADFPSLVVLDNGDWVAHWLQKTGDDSYAYEIRLVRSTDRGRTWSRAIVPHDDGTATEHGFVSMVPAGDDRVRLAWLDGRETAGAAGHGQGGHDHAGHGGRMMLRSAVLDRRGRVSDEARLDASTCSCCQTDMVRAGERTLAVYRDHGEADLRNIHWLAHARGRWSSGRPLHDDGWRIAGCPVNGPALAAGPGGVLAVWPTLQGASMVVRAALGDGRGFGAPVDLESGADTVGRVDAAPWGTDGFLAAWLGAGGTPGGTVLRLVELDRRLVVRARHAVVELPPGRSTGVPRLAAQGDEAVIAWVEAVEGRPTVRAARAIRRGKPLDAR